MTGATQEIHFPSFNYHLDESDPDIVILRRQDDSFVAAFSAWGATKEGIRQAAEQDYAAVLRENPGSLAVVVEVEKHQHD
jgi:hypothetical protein